jgi:hypothetical protein
MSKKAAYDMNVLLYIILVIIGIVATFLIFMRIFK